jgi:hypothetical protein
MADLIEHSAAWSDILRLKDTLSLRDLATRAGSTPGALSAALKRTGVVRVPPQSVVDEAMDLPPEPGEVRAERVRTPSRAEPPPARPMMNDVRGVPAEPEPAVMLPEVAAALTRVRAGSKDVLITQHAVALGQVPDAEVARRAGVSVRTIASFRARHNIPGYRGPRKLGRDDDHEESGSGEQRAWKVTWSSGGVVQEGVLIASTLAHAAQLADELLEGEVTGLQLVGALIEV